MHYLIYRISPVKDVIAFDVSHNGDAMMIDPFAVLLLWLL